MPPSKGVDLETNSTRGGLGGNLMDMTNLYSYQEPIPLGRMAFHDLHSHPAGSTQ